MEHVDNILNDTEIRVLGCLLEKEMATPEYYPLTLNALTNACNQKTNRDPVVTYDESTIMIAVDSLRARKIVRQSTIGRALKFEQIFSDARNLLTREKAVICILLLRGPQTIGEIRSRTDRMYSFSDLDEVRETLSSLEETSLVTKLALQPGRKEARFFHLLGGKFSEEDVTSTRQHPEQETPLATVVSQVDQLEEQITLLRQELEELRQEFATFRSQFE